MNMSIKEVTMCLNAFLLDKAPLEHQQGQSETTDHPEESLNV